MRTDFHTQWDELAEECWGMKEWRLQHPKATLRHSNPRWMSGWGRCGPSCRSGVSQAAADIKVAQGQQPRVIVWRRASGASGCIAAMITQHNEELS